MLYEKCRQIGTRLLGQKIEQSKITPIRGDHSRVEARQNRAALLTALLIRYDAMAVSSDHHKRGYELQTILNETFVASDIPTMRAFTRNDGGEQIDGAFKFEGWHYLVECRWRERLADIRQLDGLSGQVNRSGRQTMGLFLSIEGWSAHVPELLKQNPDKAIVLMEGFDLRCVLAGQIELHDLLAQKLAALNLRGEAFLSCRSILQKG